MTDDTSASGMDRERSHVCMLCGSPAQLVDNGRRAACPDCGNDWNLGPDPCERCNGDGWIWVLKTDAPCPDCTAYPEPDARYGDTETNQGGREEP
jgi:predicted RNA-binding Zn-ribbon protein involved in translation (DUF1610 family)